MRKQTIATAILIGVSLLAAILIDVLLQPLHPIPLLYIVPIILAVYRASPRAVAAVALLAIVANIFSDYVKGIPFAVWSGYTLVFVAIAPPIVFLAYRLTAQKTELARLYQQSEFQRARWKATVESLPDLVAVGDASGQATYVNAVYAQYLGRQIKPGLSLEEYPAYYQLYQADGTIFNAQDLPLQKAALRGKDVRNVEVVQRRTDENECVAVWNASPIRDGNGRVVGAVAVGRDVTQQRQADLDREELLKEIDRQRRLLQMIVDNAPAGIAVLDSKDLRVKWTNKVYREFNEEPYRSMDDFKGLRLQDYVPLAEESGLADIFRQVANTGQPYLNPEYEGIGFARGITYWRWTLLPVFPEAGGIPDLMVLATEITEQVVARKQIEKIAELSQRRAAELQGIIDHMVDAVIVCDQAGQLKLVNQPGLELIGLKEPGDLEGGIAAIPQLIQLQRLDGRPLAPDEMALARALKGEVVTNFDQVAVRARSGLLRYFRANAAPIRDEKGEVVGAVAVIRDVTELTELERLKGQFIDVAAHELKTPVTIMKGAAQLIPRYITDLPPAPQRLLEGMNRSADRIDRIVNEILNIGQLQEGQLQFVAETFDLSDLIEEVIGRLALTTTKHEIRLVDDVPAIITADRYRLEQVLFNLIDNAVRYSPRGGKIEVATQITDSEVVVSVRDYGVGIPKDRQARIFQRFYRAHTGTPYDYGGMGVGLYISKEIIGRHGGRIWFESEEGKGSTFHFALPVGYDPDPALVKGG